ncbi:unnamed protein product [Tilletia controversa]|nr:unnamed protein product [Tilletia controversa]
MNYRAELAGVALILGLGVLALSPSRRRVYMTRGSLMPPTARLLVAGDDMAYISAFGFDVAAFDNILERFRPHLRPVRPRRRQGRSRSLTPRLHLALALYYLTTPQRQKWIGLVFGLTPACVSRAVWSGLGAMYDMMAADPDTWAIKWPTAAIMADMAAAVRAREPLLEGVFGFVDGLNLRIYQPSNLDEQNAYYNGWLADTYCSQVLVFLANGEIAWASYNNPGSWHDAKIARALYALMSDPVQERKLTRLEEQINKTEQGITQRNMEKLQLNLERRDLSRLKAQLEVLIKDLQEADERTEEGKGRLERQLKEIEAKISEKEGELMGLAPTWEDKKAEVGTIRPRLEDTRARIEILRAKQGRSAMFATKAQRDAYINKQIKELESFGETQELNLKDLGNARAECWAQIEQLQLLGEQTTDKLEGRRDALEKLGQQWVDLKRQRDTLMEERKELWREEARLSMSVNYARDQMSIAQRQLAGSLDRATATGLQAVERISRDLGLTASVHGPLYQLFRVDDKYKTAVEVTANTSLFHIVVDTDETASKLLQVMNQERSGRVTFMPLNRLKPKKAAFPDAPDAILMIKKIQFDARFAPAFEQVFGRTLICPNLEIASAYVRSHNINAITLDGDQVDRKGSLTGGYHDPRRSRLDSVKAVTESKAEFERDSRALAELNATLSTMEQRVTMLLSQMQTIETRRAQTTANRGPLLEQLTALRRDEVEARLRFQRLERGEADLALEIQAVKTKREALQRELSTEMRPGLSEEEKAELETLTGQLAQLTEQLKEVQAAVIDLSNKKMHIEIDLNEDLKRHRSELVARIEMLGETLGGSTMAGEGAGGAASAAGASNEGNLELRKAELVSTKKHLQEREKRATAIDKELEDLETKLRTYEAQREEIRSAQAEVSREVASQQKYAERYLKKRQGLLDQRDACNKKIRDLGVLPEEAFEKYTSTAMDKLLKMLHKVNEALKKFSHVNKKAVEQYNSFTRQRDQLQDRKVELAASANSIQELIDVLDQRKDEAIERTFKQVSRNFAEVFEKLVPAGRGRLIMQKRIDAEEEEAEQSEADEDGQQSRSKIDSYTGVSIKVSFNSKSDEGLRIQQLSGGQKSLVALATVFAIQKCDPAPFYLFDEIDANLDAQYRTSVAAMIHELSDSAQFITTTFRPEMVATAEKHYGVLFSAQKISSIRTITQDEASQFVEAAADSGKP